MPSKEKLCSEQMAAELSEELHALSKQVSRNWPGVLDSEDIEQDVWIWILETWNGPQLLHGADEETRGKLIYWMANKTAKRHRNEHDLFSGNYYYSTDDVRAILNRDPSPEDDAMFEHWEQMAGEPVALPSTSPGAETLTEQMDLDEGLELLEKKKPQIAAIIWATFYHNSPIHKHRIELTRAIDALTYAMNNVHRKRDRETLHGRMGANR